MFYSYSEGWKSRHSHYHVTEKRGKDLEIVSFLGTSFVV
jgi:hypothetical protein